MANRWRLGTAAALLCAALAIPYLIPQAEAQPLSVCDDCAAKKKALAFEEDFLKFLRGQLDNLQGRVKAVNDAIQDRKPPKATDDDTAALASWNRTIRELNKAIDNANASIKIIKADLDKCGGCPPAGTKAQTGGTATTPAISPQQVPATTTAAGAAKPGGPGAPAPPADALWSHPEPVSACDDCDGRAFAAWEALGEVLTYENLVALERYRIFELREWMSAPTNQQASSAAIYKQRADELVSAIEGLDTFDKERVAAQQKLDALMLDLANCNAACKDRRPMTTPSSAIVPGPSEVAVKAECPDCEGKALELEADLARLRHVRFELERTPVSDDVFSLQNELQTKQREVAEAEKDVADDRAALDACNKAHPRASCQPPTGTSTGPGTAGGAGDATGQQKTADGKKQPVIGREMSVPIVPDANPKAPAPPQQPGGPSATPQPPSGNAPQLGIPSIGSIFGPTPGTFPGVRGFNVSLPFVEQDDDEGTEEEYFTFIVLDSAAVNDLRRAPVFKDNDIEVIPLAQYGIPSGAYQMTIAAVENRDEIADFLVGLRDRGVITRLESDVYWRAAAGGSIVPVAGAWVLYTPVSPTPSSDPRERPGDEGPPTAVRVGRDGTYSAPPGGLDGPIEIRVAKGGRERTTVTSARSDRTPLAGGTRPFETSPHSNQRIADTIRAGELGKP